MMVGFLFYSSKALWAFSRYRPIVLLIFYVIYLFTVYTDDEAAILSQVQWQLYIIRVQHVRRRRPYAA